MNEPQSTTTAKMPWFSIDGENMEPFIIGIAGASASGKTSVSHSIIEKLGAPWVTLLCMDRYEFFPFEYIDKIFFSLLVFIMR